MVLGKNLSRLIFGDETPSSITKTASEDPIHIAEGLSKVASLPYNPATYQALQGMLKIASEALVSLDKDLKSMEKKAEVRTIVDDLIEHGLTDEYDVEEKIATLLDKTPEELNTVKEAIKLSSVIIQGELFEGMDKSSSLQSRKKEMFEGIL
jgi:hypothetical protein